MFSFRIKIFFSILFLSLAALITYHIDLVKYLYKQGQGQLNIVTNAKPIHEILKVDTLALDIREKLELVGDVKSFAETSLGLTKTDNYTTYFHHTKPLMWVITACPPYQLKANKWSFPFFGGFPYIGYFDKDMAIQEFDKIKHKGLDVGLRNPSAWSTLGWFKDPIYTQQLKSSVGVLVETIIHEMVHSTIFVKDSIEFNENLASFIGKEGAIMYLKSMNNDVELEEYLKYIKQRKLVQSFTIKMAKKLDSVYSSNVFTKLDNKSKKTLKRRFIESYYDEYLCLTKRGSSNSHFLKSLNNTYFMSYIRYYNQEDKIRSLNNKRFKGKIIQLIDFYRDK